MANDIATADAGLAPIVEIATGKLRGASSAGIYSFKGIPYGASTAGRNRFMPPEPPLPWSGVRDALRLCRSRMAIAQSPEAAPGARNAARASGHDTRGRRLPDPECVDTRSRTTAPSGRSWCGCMAAPLAMARATGR